MSSRPIAPWLVLPFLLASPSPARADVAAAPMLLMGSIYMIPSAITAIGSGAQLLLVDEPRLGWPIGSMVTGSLSVAWGLIATRIVAREGPSSAGDWAIALSPVAVGLTSILLGLGSILKRGRAREHRDGFEWTVLPIASTSGGSTVTGIAVAIAL